MKLVEIITSDLEFEEIVKSLKSKGATFLDSGDYGSVYELNNKVLKITTDEIEIEHAEELKKQDTNNFVHIYDVKIYNSNLALIIMEKLDKYNGEIPYDFEIQLEEEAKKYNIDPDELDYRPSNIMIDKKTGKLKMIDV